MLWLACLLYWHRSLLWPRSHISSLMRSMSTTPSPWSAKIVSGMCRRHHASVTMSERYFACLHFFSKKSYVTKVPSCFAQRNCLEFNIHSCQKIALEAQCWLRFATASLEFGDQVNCRGHVILLNIGKQFKEPTFGRQWTALFFFHSANLTM